MANEAPNMYITMTQPTQVRYIEIHTHQKVINLGFRLKWQILEREAPSNMSYKGKAPKWAIDPKADQLSH